MWIYDIIIPHSINALHQTIILLYTCTNVPNDVETLSNDAETLSLYTYTYIQVMLTETSGKADTGFLKGSDCLTVIRIKTLRIHAHMRDVVSLFMKIGGPQSGGWSLNPKYI